MTKDAYCCQLIDQIDAVKTELQEYEDAGELGPSWLYALLRDLTWINGKETIELVKNAGFIHYWGKIRIK